MSDPRDDLYEIMDRIFDEFDMPPGRYEIADAIIGAGWRPPNPCDHSGRAVLAPQYQSDPPTFWCQMCGESGLTYPAGYTYPDNKRRTDYNSRPACTHLAAVDGNVCDLCGAEL